MFLGDRAGQKLPFSKRINVLLNQLGKLYEQANESIRISEAYARLRPNNQSVASSA
jgi:hypothetical protein